MSADYRLAIDCSQGNACVALLNQCHVLSECSITARNHSRHLATTVMDMMAKHQVENQLIELVFVAGPGSFTGLRIAAATINGLNTALHLPIRQLSSLCVSAAACSDDKALWVIEDARAGECFYARYLHAQAVNKDDCCSINQLPEIDVYTGSQALPAMLPQATFIASEYSRAKAIGHALNLQAQSPTYDYAQPHYLQRSQAERQAVVQ